MADFCDIINVNNFYFKEMPRKLVDLTGHTFGRLTVLSRDKNDSQNKPQWLCECVCGNFTVVMSYSLQSGKSKSCGCLRKELTRERKSTHGMHKTREYSIWKNMKARCYNPNNTSYGQYGGRGISVCERWLNNDGFKNFFEDMGTSNGLTLDRIDVEKGYNLENCRWADHTIQAINQRAAKNNKFGQRGVHEAQSGGYIAALKLHGKYKINNTFPTLNDAINARKEAEEKYYAPLLKI